jgi:hypothetical protein
MCVANRSSTATLLGDVDALTGVYLKTRIYLSHFFYCIPPMGRKQQPDSVTLVVKALLKQSSRLLPKKTKIKPRHPPTEVQKHRVLGCKVARLMFMFLFPTLHQSFPTYPHIFHHISPIFPTSFPSLYSSSDMWYSVCISISMYPPIS